MILSYQNVWRERQLCGSRKFLPRRVYDPAVLIISLFMHCEFSESATNMLRCVASGETIVKAQKFCLTPFEVTLRTVQGFSPPGRFRHSVHIRTLHAFTDVSHVPCLSITPFHFAMQNLLVFSMSVEFLSVSSIVLIACKSAVASRL